MNAIINKTIINNACQVMQNQGFEGFYRSLVEQFVPNISKTYYQEFVNRTGRATLPLTSHNDALFYSVAYAMGHYQIFRAVLADGLVIEERDRVLNVIDYGCGQGVATLAMLDHIATFNDPKSVHLNIHLIEPSSIALGNAYYKVLTLAQALGFSVNITSQNCTLDNAIVPNFANQADNLHLMSYILDVEAVQNQLHHITAQIRELAGVNHIIASGINTPAGYLGFNMLSRQLIGYHQKIKSYQPNYRAYRVIQGCYGNVTAKAIGFIVSLNNDLVLNQIA